MTRTLIYGIIALVIVIIAALIAFVFTGPTTTNTDGSNDGGGLFSSLFPFNFGGGNGQPLFEGDETPSETDDTPAPVLRQVSVDPVAGGLAYENEDGVTMMRFIDRATGHLYETEAEKTTVRRVTNTTIPGIQETLWITANDLIIRYLNGEDIETFLVSLDPDEEGEQRLNGSFINSYTRAALDPQKENLLALFIDDGVSSLVLSEVDGSDAREVLTSPITSWAPLQSESSLFVHSAPLSGSDGFLYQISGGALVKITGNIPGLTAHVAVSGDYALISGGETNVVTLGLVDTTTGTLLESPVGTLSAKCTLTSTEIIAYCGVPNTLPNGAYPNDWLLGRVSFSDSIWEINFEEGVATLVSDPENEVGQSIDVYNPSLSPDGSHLLFMNKRDLSLWSLRLRESATTTAAN